MKPRGHCVLRFTLIGCFGIATLLAPLVDAAAGRAIASRPAEAVPAAVTDGGAVQTPVAVRVEALSDPAPPSARGKAGSDGLAAATPGSAGVFRNRSFWHRRGTPAFAPGTLSLVDAHVRLQI